MTAPIILCGLGRTGARVLTYLRAAGLPVVVVDDRCKPDDPRLLGARLVSGDCREADILHRAGVIGARGVLVMTNDDLANVSTTLQVRALDAEVRIIVRLFDQNLLDRIGQTVHNVFALSTADLAAPVLAMTAMTGSAIGTFRLGDDRDDSRLVAEVVVDAHDKLHGRTITEAIDQRGAVCLAHLPFSGWERLPGHIDGGQALLPGDLVVVCGEPRELGPILRRVEDGEIESLRWASYLRRMGRVGWRTLAEVDLMVLLCTVVLLTVVAISTTVLHLGGLKYSVSKALFRTVSIMATSADMYHRDFEDMPRMQVFVSSLRIIGAVLLAAFTAIVTNYLLRARFGGALEARRIPESGHVIVCGLGSIGFLTVKELLRHGERVVAVEKDPSNPYIHTARRLGAVVLIGDATLAEVQKQGRMKSAYSIIAAASNDLTNLSIALLAREANPAQRIVVLISEQKLAGMLRQAGVELALSIPAMAAPAFLAALYGDRVRTVVMVRRHLLAVLDVVIHVDDPLIGLGVAESAARYRFCAIAHLDEKGEAISEQNLALGQRLVVVVSLPDLEALLGRGPVRKG